MSSITHQLATQPTAAEPRGEKARVIAAVTVITIWVMMGLISATFLQRSLFDSLFAILAAIFSVSINVWAYRNARTANDFLTVTGTTRLIGVAFSILVLYEMASQLSGGSFEPPAAVNAFVQGQFAFLIGPIGITSILFTDFFRAFTIPTKVKMRKSSAWHRGRAWICARLCS